MATTRYTPEQLAEIDTIRGQLDLIARRRHNGWTWDRIAADHGADTARIARLCIC